MDVAKYIGLFLLKNQACYIHGLGNLELKKKPATFNGETLQAGTFEVFLTASGSIDDNLANFIATNELISISKASNELREYSTQAKLDLAAGKDVVIPAIGKFTEADGKLRFITDPHLQYAPPPIPALRSSRRIEEEQAIPATSAHNTPRQREKEKEYSAAPQYNNGPKPAPGFLSQLNWGRIGLAAFLLLIIAVGGIYTLRYMRNRNSNTNSTTEQTMVPLAKDTMAPIPTADTTAKIDSTSTDSTGTIVVQGNMLHFKVIIDNFPNRKKAEKKARLMVSYGHVAEVIAEDSTSFDVVMPVVAPASDTARIMDSMRRYYNPAGVYIY